MNDSNRFKLDREASRGTGEVHVVYGPLAEAIRRESNQAVCHWWGVTPQTVTKWRKALGVDHTEGTSRLRSEYRFEPLFIATRRRGHAKTS
jgi:hypothetical protein